ncbi:hypothetical protein [Hoeflea alexandrii]|uniref:hypothetical protein n=1 Tax=Hoeflea alexandrii TaxID=288436 RepID=UPI0036D331DE
MALILSLTVDLMINGLLRLSGQRGSIRMVPADFTHLTQGTAQTASDCYAQVLRGNHFEKTL